MENENLKPAIGYVSGPSREPDRELQWAALARWTLAMGIASWILPAVVLSSILLKRGLQIPILIALLHLAAMGTAIVLGFISTTSVKPQTKRRAYAGMGLALLSIILFAVAPFVAI